MCTLPAPPSLCAQVQHRSATLTKGSLSELFQLQPRLRSLLASLSRAERRRDGGALGDAVGALLDALPAVSPSWPLPAGAKGWASLQHGDLQASHPPFASTSH